MEEKKTHIISDVSIARFIIKNQFCRLCDIKRDKYGKKGSSVFIFEINEFMRYFISLNKKEQREFIEEFYKAGEIDGE